MKQSLDQEDITVINIYASNNGTSKYTRQNWQNLREKETSKQ